MKPRPRLKEALSVLEQLTAVSIDAKQALEEYNKIKMSGNEFLAARFVVDIVDLFNSYQYTREVVND